MNRSFTGFLAFVLAAGAGVLVHQVALSGVDIELPFLSPKGKAESLRPPSEVIAKATPELAALVKADAGPSAGDQVARLLEAVHKAYARLDQEVDDKAKLRQAKNSALIAHYAGVAVDRSRFAKPFDEFARQLIAENPKSAVAHKAEMLQLLARHDLSQSVERKFVTDVKQFVANHSPQQSAALYSMTAVELVRNGQRDSAKAIVRHGLKTLRSSSVAVSKLVNQSANLGLSKPPPPRYTQAHFNAMMRSYESRASNAASSSCGPRRT